MLPTLGMGWRLLVRTRLLLMWLLGMAFMAYNNHFARGIDPGLRVASWVVFLTSAPVFVCALFAREYLSWEGSFLAGSEIRGRFLRLNLLLCCLAGAVGAAARPQSALAMAALAFGGAALTGVVTLRFARWGMFVWMLAIFWPLFMIPSRTGAWVFAHAWIGLAVGAACVALHVATLAGASWHRGLCTRRVAHLADWWDLERFEKRRAESSGSLRTTFWMLERARRATLTGHQRAARFWQGAYPVVTCGRSVPGRFANNAVGAVIIIFMALYVDSFVAGRTSMHGWFAGMIVMPALSLLPGLVRLGRRNGLLLSRASRHRAGLAIGMASVALGAAAGAVLWSLGTILAHLIPAWTVGGRAWACTAPPLHVLFLVPAIAPAPLLFAAARRVGSPTAQLQLSFPLFLILHGVLSMAPGVVAAAIVGGLSATTFLAFLFVWHRRCFHADVPE